MSVAYDEAALQIFEKQSYLTERPSPVISKFIENAREIEIDGVAKKRLRVCKPKNRVDPARACGAGNGSRRLNKTAALNL